MGFLSSIFGGKPSVPAWNNVNLDEQQTKAITANQASLPGIENLATGVDTFNEQQLTDLLNKVMPGWSGNVDQAQTNISQELQGKVPTDVSNELQSNSAAKALTGGMGFGAGTLGGAGFAKSLGLTSLSLMGQGESSLESWTSMVDKMYAPGQLNVSSMFISPQDEFTSTMQNQEMQWSRDWLQSQEDAMPDPVMSGIFQELDPIKLIGGLLHGQSGGRGISAGMGGNDGGGGIDSSTTDSSGSGGGGGM